MNPELKQAIAEELRLILNREPLDSEVLNAQNDLIVMGRIRDKQIGELQDTQKKHTKDISDMKKKVK